MMDFSKYDLKVVIVAQNQLLLDSLRDNFLFSQDAELLHLNELSNLAQFDKIDILLIDQPVDNVEIPEYKIRSIINLSGVAIDDREIVLPKPYKLSDIAIILQNNVENNKLFVPLSDGWIFNELESRFQNSGSLIRLTEKENKIIHFLVNAKNMTCDKKELFKSVWQYSSNSETSTLETHLYKLRQKLPGGMLKIENSICNLNYG